jgi:hypothetical protein
VTTEVEVWLAGVRGELNRVAATIEPLLAEQSRLREREALLVKLLQSLAPSSILSEGTGAPTAPSAPVVLHEGSVLSYVRSCVLEVLREGGGAPMHINDIHSRFVAKGFRVPGAGRPANLTAHLSRCEGIVSPSRGFYAVGESAEVQKTKQQRRRRKRR